MLPPLQGLPHGLSLAAPAPCCVAAAVVAVAAAPPVTRLAAAGLWCNGHRAHSFL
jgi:hypothetical protein